MLLQSASSFLQTRLLSVQAQHLISILRARVQRHLIRLPVAFFDDNQTGALTSRVMRDVEGVRNLIGTGLAHLVGGALTSVVVLVLMLRISVPMTLFTLVPIALFGVLSGRAFRAIRPVFRERGAINAEVTGRLTESLSGIRVIKGFHAEKPRRRGLLPRRAADLPERAQVADRHQHADQRWGAAHGALRGADHGRGGVADPARRHDRRRLSSRSACTWAVMVAPVVQMTRIGTEITDAFAGLDRTEELLANPPEGHEPERTVALPRLSAGTSSSRASPSATGKTRRCCTASACGRTRAR